MREFVGTDANIPAFVINLDRDIERLQDISSALTRLGVPYERIPAINAKDRMTLIRRVIRRDFHFAPANRPMKAGEIGCYLSHVAALKRIVRKNLSMAIIFEDDAAFDERFPQFYKHDLARFLTKSDIVKFEGIHYAHTSKSGVSLIKGEAAQLVVPLKPALGSAAYAVTRKGAIELIKALSVTDRPLYIYLDVAWRYADVADAVSPDHRRYVASEQVAEIVEGTVRLALTKQQFDHLGEYEEPPTSAALSVE